MAASRVLIRSRWVWLAWYPRRGRRCNLFWERCEDGWHAAAAVGPLYLGVGPGSPSVDGGWIWPAFP